MPRVLTVDGSVKIGAKVYGVEITNKLDMVILDNPGVFASEKEEQKP